jgi:hypothetical protein
MIEKLQRLRIPHSSRVEVSRYKRELFETSTPLHGGLYSQFSLYYHRHAFDASTTFHADITYYRKRKDRRAMWADLSRTMKLTLIFKGSPGIPRPSLSTSEMCADPLLMECFYRQTEISSWPSVMAMQMGRSYHDPNLSAGGPAAGTESLQIFEVVSGTQTYGGGQEVAKIRRGQRKGS